MFNQSSLLKNFTCLVALLDTRWQKSEDTFITMVEVSLHNGHIVIEIGLNFMLDLKKRFVAETLPVLIQLCRVNMRLEKITLVVHHMMTYRVKSYLFLLDHSLIPAVLVSGDAKVQILKNHRKHELTFPLN